MPRFVMSLDLSVSMTKAGSTYCRILPNGLHRYPSSTQSQLRMWHTLFPNPGTCLEICDETCTAQKPRDATNLPGWNAFESKTNSSNVNVNTLEINITTLRKKSAWVGSVLSLHPSCILWENRQMFPRHIWASEGWNLAWRAVLLEHHITVGTECFLGTKSRQCLPSYPSPCGDYVLWQQ